MDLSPLALQIRLHFFYHFSCGKLVKDKSRKAAILVIVQCKTSLHARVTSARTMKRFDSSIQMTHQEPEVAAEARCRQSMCRTSQRQLSCLSKNPHGKLSVQNLVSSLICCATFSKMQMMPAQKNSHTKIPTRWVAKEDQWQAAAGAGSSGVLPALHGRLICHHSL